MSITTILAEKFMELCSEENITQIVRGVLEEVITSPKERDAEPLTENVTMGEFKKLHGFYGSVSLLEYMCGVASARLLRTMCMALGLPITPETAVILTLSDENEQKAARNLQKYFTEKFGPVSDERVEELDTLVKGWEKQAEQQLREKLGVAKNTQA